jgi:three-Cys-motif partner protein
MADPLEHEGQVEPEQRTLFELPPITAAEPQLRQLPHPIWTENKAKLIAKYIHLFLMITKHGTYIDGFAGPQQPEKPEMWAAKLVLDVEPKWLRHFYLFEKRKAGCDLLKYLKASHVGPTEREVEVFCGDFNEEIDKLLNSGRIGQKEATFCLLDQRTFECHWKTVEKLARYKMAGNNKIELFYFLAGWWYRRAVTAIKDESVLTNWWGRDDWSRLRTMKLHEVRDEIVSRFKSELLYMSAMAWPILGRNGRDMYYMIHTTDHSEAPMQMRRAYEQAVQPTTASLQSEFWP